MDYWRSLLQDRVNPSAFPLCKNLMEFFKSDGIMCKNFMMLSREILEDPMYLSERFTHMQAFSDLCYLAAFKERTFMIRGNKVTVKQGQVAKSVRDLAIRWQWSVNTVMKFISELKEDGYIDTQKTSVNQIITIKKYLLFNTQSETDSDTQDKTQNDTQNDTPIKYIEELKKEINILKERLTKVSPKKEQNFVPPTVVDVAAYIQEKGYHFDAESFVSFYESKGWMIGKNRMKDWRSACRTWENKKKEQEPSLFSQPQFPPNPRHGDKFGNNEWFYSGEEERWIKNGEVDRRGRVFIVQAGKWCV